MQMTRWFQEDQVRLDLSKLEYDLPEKICSTE